MDILAHACHPILPVNRHPRGPSKTESVLTLRDVADMLKLSEKSIYRRAQRGEMPAFKVGGTWRFKRDDIDEWIERQKLRVKGTR